MARDDVLQRTLALNKGECSPFGLLNDRDKEVRAELCRMRCGTSIMDGVNQSARSPMSRHQTPQTHASVCPPRVFCAWQDLPSASFVRHHLNSFIPIQHSVQQPLVFPPDPGLYARRRRPGLVLGAHHGLCVPARCTQVQYIIDAAAMEQPLLWFHPLTNEASTCITPQDLLTFVAACGRTARIVDFAAL